MSKLHKSQRRSVRPKMSMKKPKATDASVGAATAATAAKEAGKFGKAMGTVGGALGIASSALGLIQGIKGLKSKKQKPAVKKEDLQVAGRVQKPALSTKKKTKKGIANKKQILANANEALEKTLHNNPNKKRKIKRIQKDIKRKEKALKRKQSKIK